MAIQRIFLVIFLSVALSACERRIDTSSKEAYQKSVESMSAALDEETRSKFFTALQLASCVNVSLEPSVLEKIFEEGRRAFVIETHLTCAEGPKNWLNGLTAAQVIDRYKGERLLTWKEVFLRDAREVRQEAVFLRNTIAKKNDGDRETLEAIKLSLAGSAESYNLNVSNGSTVALQAIDIEFEARGLGRQIPYENGKLSISFDGGLEPGERDTSYSIGNGLTLFTSINGASIEKYGAASYRFKVVRAVLPEARKIPEPLTLATPIRYEPLAKIVEPIQSQSDPTNGSAYIATLAHDTHISMNDLETALDLCDKKIEQIDKALEMYGQ